MLLVSLIACIGVNMMSKGDMIAGLTKLTQVARNFSKEYLESKLRT